MPVPGIGGCFRCRGRDHWADNCPELIPVATKAEHEARIAKYIDWWIDGRITAHEKQKLIECENRMWAAMQPAKRRAS